MQGLTATPRRVNASRSLAFHLGACQTLHQHTVHMSHGSIHSIRKIATLPIRPVPPANESPAPASMVVCIPRGNPAGSP